MADPRPIEYTVRLHAPQTQAFEISMRVRNIQGAHLNLALPAWRAGRYAILNPAGTLSRVEARRPSGEVLAIRKIDKAFWQVATEGCSDIQIHYTVYANSLGDRTRHVDDTHAFLSGATVFLFVPERRSDAVAIHVKAPKNWKLSCSLDVAADCPQTLLAPSYDILIDSPIEVGIHETLNFTIDGIPHDIVLWGAPPFDGERLVREFSAVVRQHVSLFGELPYSRYIFMIHVSPGIGGGTEHLQSTIIQVPPSTFEDPAKYRRLLGTAAHEMFHVWNVKRLRPAALAAAELSRETYTDLLWFCEGTTSYYEELILARAGLIRADEYLQALGDEIHHHRQRPGSAVQSLAEASFDAWIKFNQPTANDFNTTVSFYESGAVVSFLLDLELRFRSDNRVSLDTVMREMVARFPASGPGFTTADLIDVCSRISGSRFDAFFASYISGTDPFPLEERVDVIGLQLERDAVGTHAYSGIFTQLQNGKQIVRRVLSDGPAYSAGVLPGDEIVSEHGTAAGENVRLDILRRGKLRSVEFKMGETPQGSWRLSPVPSPSEAQRAAYTSWLQQPWPQ